MGIRSVLKGGLGKSNPNGIYEMVQNNDCAGLIDIMDKVVYDNIPLVLQYLTELSENGWYDRIISYGALPKAIELMSSGHFVQRKEAMFLISSLVSHGRCDIVLVNDNVIENMMDLIEEEEMNDDVLRYLMYCMSMFCSMGGAETFIQNGGIERIAPAIRSDDEMTVLYTLYTLNTISSMGYQKEILKTNVTKYIGYHVPEKPEIESLSQMLLDDLYEWKDESFSVDEDELEIIDNGYQRPEIKKQRIEPRNGTILGYDGEEFQKMVDKEIVVELKRRRLENRKVLEDRSQQLQDMMKKNIHPVKAKAADRVEKNVKQRVVKKRPIENLSVERNVENVISGSLDGMKADLSEISLETTPLSTEQVIRYIFNDPENAPKSPDRPQGNGEN